MTTHFDRDTSGFARASHQSQALCLGCLATAGLLAPVATLGFGDPVRVTASWLAAAGGAFLLRRVRWHWKAHRRMLVTDGDVDGMFGRFDSGGVVVAGLPPDLLQHGELHPDIRRILDVAASKFPDKLRIDVGAVEFDDDSKGGRRLVSWGFRCMESGFLTDTGTQQRLQTTFLKGIGGIWSFSFDPRADTFGASRKSSIPKLAFPPMWPVVSGADEAKQRYTGWEFKVGVGTEGEIGVCLEKMAHVKVIGETGSGKSVAVRSWLEQFRAMGWMLLLADGKGADYAGYFAPQSGDRGLPVPGTVAVGLGSSPRGMSYVGAIVLAYQIMQERQLGSLEDKINNPESWNAFVPVLLVMDEIKGMREKWKNNLGKDEAKAIESMITEITALGRELRVHVMLISQDARDQSIPGVWSSNLPLSISLGKPNDMTMNKAFEESVAPKVRMVRESMDPKIKGRCLIASVDPVTGAADALEYQGYLGYSPGESWDNAKLPAQAKTEWPKFKSEVSDKVPRLYTRQWFRVEQKSEAQLAAESKGEPDKGYIDFDMFTVDEIKRMERVPLDKRGSDGKIVPNAEMVTFDPLSRQYVCRPPVRTKRGFNPEL